VSYPGRLEDATRSVFVSSLTFSSGSDGNDILAIGRSNGSLSLWALDENDDKFACSHPAPISCVSFRPLARKRSTGASIIISTEELLVGDETGVVYFYSVQWEIKGTRQGIMGSMNMLARIHIHSQQICGIAWSPDGAWFATGGNDNLCLLFHTRDIVGKPESRSHERSSTSDQLEPSEYIRLSIASSASLHQRTPSSATQVVNQKERFGNRERIPKSPRSPRFQPKTDGGVRHLVPGDERQAWIHAAAIKAIAFCPWQRSLLAVGGGSNDRAIHFYHTRSGACLGTIDVLAQVTSLIWSKTRREIVATFGYPQPEHSYRIAVFMWPECKQILAIPWLSECRALYAIPYPGGPNDPKSRRSSEGKRWWKRTDDEGSIVIACSDSSVKFQEVWCDKARKVRHGPGILAWSDILEGLEGVDKSEDNTIR
jgi:WD40 repeat protein